MFLLTIWALFLSQACGFSESSSESQFLSFRDSEGSWNRPFFRFAAYQKQEYKDRVALLACRSLSEGHFPQSIKEELTLEGLEQKGLIQEGKMPFKVQKPGLCQVIRAREHLPSSDETHYFPHFAGTLKPDEVVDDPAYYFTSGPGTSTGPLLSNFLSRVGQACVVPGTTIAGVVGGWLTAIRNSDSPQGNNPQGSDPKRAFLPFLDPLLNVVRFLQNPFQGVNQISPPFQRIFGLGYQGFWLTAAALSLPSCFGELQNLYRINGYVEQQTLQRGYLEWVQGSWASVSRGLRDPKKEEAYHKALRERREAEFLIPAFVQASMDEEVQVKMNALYPFFLNEDVDPIALYSRSSHQIPLNYTSFLREGGI